ncbi:MAG: hypothetical protein KF791_16605 [Verrucomicrobiae bacterium]|nr:hypothetical protein [Verrucomicrobiae bacterium]
MLFPTARRLVLTVLFASTAIGSARAERILEYQGEARVAADRTPGSVAYLEKHRVTLEDDGRFVRAETRYESPEGRLLAELRSDFSDSLTVPSHVFVDHRTGHSYGLRREDGRIVLFDQKQGKPERVRVLTAEDAGDRLLVGCQGLNYYLVGRLDELKPSSRVPVRFLIPGKLDYYDFGLTARDASPDGTVAFDVTIQNWFLRLFAPKLEVKYDKASQRLVGYRGISNLLNDRGENQAVTITYTY